MILKKPAREKFDVTVPEHRAAAYTAIRERSWSKTPYKFELEPEYTDLMTMVREKLLTHYFDNDKQAPKA